MKLKKTSTDKTIAADQTKTRKSTRPTTGAGKRRARMNALKNGFFAKELRVSEEDRPEFEQMRDSLAQQYQSATPMQQIAFETIVCCCWRCKVALRIESRAVALQPSPKQGAHVEGAGGETNQMERWYGADYRSLQNGLHFLNDLRAIVADSGLLQLAEDGPLKESVIKGFGKNFYDRLMEWEGMSTTAIGAAEHMAAMQETFKWKFPWDFSLADTAHGVAMRETSGSKSPVVDRPEDPAAMRERLRRKRPPVVNIPMIDPEHPETPKVVADPKLKWQMDVKLVEAEIEHLKMLVRTRGQDFRETPLALAELSPRFYADASRDLHRAVDWFMQIKKAKL
jgi:hypothetical protein